MVKVASIKNIIKNSGLQFACRSKKTSVTSNTQVLLGDTIGELNFLYSLADVAFVGGSLVDHGGQNLLEPSAQSLPLLSGPSLRNFLDISDQLKLNEGLTIVNNSKELSDAFIKYIADDQEIKRAGNKAFEVFRFLNLLQTSTA